MGAPEDIRKMQFGATLHLVTVYLNVSFQAQVELPCAASPHDLWHAPVNILWVKGINTVYSPAAWNRAELMRCEGSGRS
jgi:hypothetical protein